MNKITPGGREGTLVRRAACGRYEVGMAGQRREEKEGKGRGGEGRVGVPFLRLMSYSSGERLG